jgi:hypothetical protein
VIYRWNNRNFTLSDLFAYGGHGKPDSVKKQKHKIKKDRP